MRSSAPVACSSAYLNHKDHKAHQGPHEVSFRSHRGLRRAFRIGGSQGQYCDALWQPLFPLCSLWFKLGTWASFRNPLPFPYPGQRQVQRQRPRHRSRPRLRHTLNPGLLGRIGRPSAARAAWSRGRLPDSLRARCSRERRPTPEPGEMSGSALPESAPPASCWAPRLISSRYAWVPNNYGNGTSVRGRFFRSSKRCAGVVAPAPAKAHPHTAMESAMVRSRMFAMELKTKNLKLKTEN